MDDKKRDERDEPTDQTDRGGDDRDREEVARRAYRRFEERGGQHGGDEADWLEAEREVRRDRSSGESVERGTAEDSREESVKSGRARRGRGTKGAAMDEDTARSSGTGPTPSSTGTGPGGDVRTPGTAVSGGPTKGGR